MPSGVAEAVERMRSRREDTNRALEAAAGGAAETAGVGGEEEEAGVLLELEDIARERCGQCVAVGVCARDGDPPKIMYGRRMRSDRTLFW